MNRMKFLVLLIVFVVGLALQPFAAQATKVVYPYNRIYEGIEVANGWADTPRLQNMYAVRISLRNPQVSLFASHDNGTAPYEVTLERPDYFMYGHGLKVAANATFWNAAQSPNADVYGLVVSNGTVVSGVDATFNGQLYFTNDKIANLRNSMEYPPAVWQGVGGGGQVLTNGVITTTDNSINPYTFYGLSQDGKYLIILAVDGRQSGYSEGCTMPEMAQWLLDFGAWNGMQMDGGGSTCISRADVGVWNRPCYGYVRSVAVSLGANSTGYDMEGPCVVWDGTRMNVFVRGCSQHIYRRTWTSGGGWANWVDIAGNTIHTPGACSWGGGRVDLFNIDSSGGPWWAHDDSGSNSWTGSFLQGGTLAAPAACSWGNGRMDCFITGMDNQIYQKTYSNSQWQASWWTAFPYPTWTARAPAACSWGTNRIDLFHNNNNGDSFWAYYNGSTWTNWANIGINTPHYLAVCSSAANRIDMIHISSGGQVVYDYYANGSWTVNAVNLGNESVGNPGVCSRGAGLLDVFVRTKNDHLWQRSCNNGTWGNWADLGAYYN